MRFEKFLETYVRELTGQRSLRANVLVNVCQRKEHAREACFFYLFATGRMPMSLALAEGKSYRIEWAEVYQHVRECDSFDSLWQAEPSLPARYGKVLRSYYAAAHKAQSDERLKRRMREDFVSWSSELGLSNRSVALKAGVDPSNFNAFMRRQELGRLSVDAVQRVSRAYVEMFRERA